MKDDMTDFTKMDELEALIVSMKIEKEKYIEKVFINIDKEASLIDFLNTYTKAELDDIRQVLQISGISSLKKSALVEALNDNIKDNLTDIIKRLTDREYKLIKKIVNTCGFIKYQEQYEDLLTYFRKLGIVNTAILDNYGKCLVIPVDIRDSIHSILSQLAVVNRIKLNERVNRIVRGLLFYYGVLEHMDIADKINPFLKEPVDFIIINEILFENLFKESGMELEALNWCHMDCDDYNKIIKEQKKRKTLDFPLLTLEQVLTASEENYMDFNNSDKSLINYLIYNFDISKLDAEEFVNDFKIDFKNGIGFNEIMEHITECFEMTGIEQLQEMLAIVQLVYNNSIQWFLKGHSPNEVATNKGKL